MKFKIFMTTATALGALLSTGVLAENNTAVIDQGAVTGGDYNSTLIVQSGNSNVVGTDDEPLTQDGDYNTTNINQTSSTAAPSTHGRNRNEVGVHNDSSGVDQIGDRNELNIVQSTTTTNFPNVVFEVRQTGDEEAAELTNLADITQNAGAGNSMVGEVHQTNSGDGMSQTLANRLTIVQTGSHSIGRHSNVAQTGGVYQDGTSNTATIDQTGYGSGQKIYKVIQDGTGNFADIDMSGAGNRLQLLDQDGTNDAVINISGTNNGHGGNSDYAGTLRNASALADVQASSIIQGGNGNEVNLNISGNTNQFGITQDGTDNNAANVIVSGVNNSLGVRQYGTGNDFDLSTIAGNDNVLGLNQDGTSNFATIDIGGNGNGDGTFTGRFAPAAAGTNPSGLVSQVGADNSAEFTIGALSDENEFSLTQSGNENLLLASIDGGDLNQLVIVQTSTGTVGINDADVAISGGSNNVAVRQGKSAKGGIQLDLTISGSSNNLNVDQGNNSNSVTTIADVNITGSFNNSVVSFDAGGAASDALYSNSKRVSGSGQISQGNGSELEYNVTGDSNRFAFYQGAQSTIDGTTIGNLNQVVVNQGLANSTSFVQNGSNNNLGVLQ